MKRFWLDQPSGVCYHDYAPKNVQFRSENRGSFQFDLLLILFPLQLDPEMFSFSGLASPASACAQKHG
jgi:hypothetical protein